MPGKKGNGTLYVPMRLRPKIEVEVVQHPFAPKAEAEVHLPEGCAGVLFAFRTKTAARKYYGRGVELMEVKCRDE